ncbi:NAD-P-binding protein [Mycena alexandri]|uniref:NAD-P-binding protein n=1 Tax=Mycena alexandri TaxID=1745969 RepID=A0AAD6T9P7_9AGAR|nr:NAD-P-binding protein [Mycena alexandri]
MSATKLILVIGATGAQGMAAIDGLLESRGGVPSPYKIRALTRDVNGARAKALEAKGVECVQGTFEDFAAVARAMDGVYGAYVNTDTFTVGEMREIYAGLKIFEIANATPSLRHYLWSGLPYMPKTRAGYDPRYQAEHLNAKGRVTEFIKGMPSNATDTGLSWSIMNTGVYMEMLEAPYVGPFNVRADGTRVFASQMEDGKMSMMTLKDIGFWTRWIFDHRAEASGQDLNVASDMLDWDTLVATFTRVTGHPAVHLRLAPEEWWSYFIDADVTPMAAAATRGDGSTTVKENYTRWWALYRDGIIERDMDWIRSIHPGTQSVEMWMRETGYTGIPDAGPLKGSSGIIPDLEKMKSL